MGTIHVFFCIHTSNYDYDQLCEEIESNHTIEDESIANFHVRLIQHPYRFHDDDWPSIKECALLRISLICKQFSKAKHNFFFGDVDSTQSEDFEDEDNKLDPHKSLGFPLFPLGQEVVSLDIDVPRSSESIHNVSYPEKKVMHNSSLMSFG